MPESSSISTGYFSRSFRRLVFSAASSKRAHAMRPASGSRHGVESGQSSSCRWASSRSTMSVSISRKRWAAAGDSQGGVISSIWLSAQSVVM